MTTNELKELDDQAHKAGMKRNKAMRIAARKIGGYLETDKETKQELRKISRSISGIATNVNQIAKVANIQ